MNKIRVISWNISLKNPIEKKVKYLKNNLNEVNGIRIVALQEVKEKDKQYLLDQQIFDQSVYSLDFRKPGQFDTTNRKLGCFVGIIGNVEVIQVGIIQRAPFPDRTVFIDVSIDGFSFKVLCFHSLTGVGYKKTKSAQFTAIAEYLYQHKEIPMISCFDANEPEVDHYDIEKVKFFDKNGDRGVGASLILGAKPVHNMKDTFRTWLRRMPDTLQEMKAKQESCQDVNELKYTPLTTSHKIQGRFPKRYDYVLSSDEFMVGNVVYSFEDSLLAGSDHAMVVADLQVNHSRA